jgi:hypothetical protein
MKPPWKQSVADNLTITDGRGIAIPVAVKGYTAGSIAPLQRLAQAPGVHLVHDGNWPPIAVIGWSTLNQIVQIGPKPVDPDD